MASWAASVAGSRAAPSERSERTSSGSEGSGIRDVEPFVSRELGVGDGGASPGARLVASHEIGQAVRGEALALEPEHRDGSLDLLGRPFDFDEIVHARVPLEPDHRAVEIVLHDLAVDRDADLVSEPRQDLRERIGVRDRGGELLAELVGAVPPRRTLPIQRRAHLLAVPVPAHAQDVVPRGHRAIVGVPPPVLEPAGIYERGAGALDGGAAAVDVVHYALELDLEHRGQSARIARTTAVESVRSAKTAAAPHARSSSTE